MPVLGLNTRQKQCTGYPLSFILLPTCLGSITRQRMFDMNREARIITLTKLRIIVNSYLHLVLILLFYKKNQSFENITYVLDLDLDS